MLLNLALRNVLRQKARTAVTLAAICMGVAGLIVSNGFVSDIIIQLGEAIIHSQTGHIQVFRKDFLDKGTRQPTKFLIERPTEVSDELRQIPEVELVTGRLSFAGLLNNGKRDVAIVGEGIEPDNEARLGTHLTLVSGRHLTNADTAGIMLGQGVAQSLGLAPGHSVTLLINTVDGALNTLDLEVVGIFQTFSKDFDARAARIPLKAAQELLQVDGVNLLLLMLAGTESTAASMGVVKHAISGADLDCRSWNQLSDFYEKSVEMYRRQFGVLRLIVLLMVLLSVANTVNMSLFERTREFGTVMAIGDRSSMVFKLIVVESSILGVMGAITGMGLGCLLALVISAIGIPMPPPPNANIGYTALIRLEALPVLISGGIGFCACFLASLIPARRAAQLDIGDALRHGV